MIDIQNNIGLLDIEDSNEEREMRSVGLGSNDRRPQLAEGEKTN